MIFVKNYMFDIFYKSINAEFTGIDVKNEYQGKAASLPLVTFEEKSNVVDIRRMSLGRIENAAVLTYEIAIYYDKTANDRYSAEEILRFSDVFMGKLGFVRIMCSSQPNFADLSVGRIVTRYKGRVCRNGNVIR